MRSLKKISAILLVVAMVFSIMSINVLATEENKFDIIIKADKTSVAQGGNVNIQMYYKYNSYTGSSEAEMQCLNVGFGAKLPVGVVASYVDDSAAAPLIKKGNCTFVNATETQEGQFLFVKDLSGDEVMLKPGEQLYLGKFNFSFSNAGEFDLSTLKVDNQVSIADGIGNECAKNYISDIVTINKAVTVASVVAPADQTFSLGTTDEQIKNALKELEITVNGANVESDPTDTGKLKISEWTSTDFVADTASETGFTFTGELKSSADGLVTVPADFANKTVSVKVKVGKIALDEQGVEIAPITKKTYQKVEDSATEKTKTAAAIAEELNKDNAYKTVAVKKGTYTGTANIAWTAASGAADLDLTKVTDEEGNSKNIVTLTGKLTAPADSKFFKDGTADKTVTMVVKVVPAEIKGGSFELTDSTFVPNTKPSVKVTIPASVVANMPVPTESDEAEVKAKYTVTISVPSKTEGAAPEIKSVELDKTVIQAAKDAVAAAAGDPEKLAKIEPITTTITLDKTLSDLGYDYSKDDKKAFTVSVTVGGTTLLTKDGKDSVDGTVVKPSAGGSSGSIGINKGNTTKTYAVTVVETKNGTATVSPDKAAQGTTVTVKAEPAEGYKVKTVTVTKADGTNVPVDEKAYTFTMPASAVKVTVEFEEGKDEPSVDPTPAKDKFADVADDFWAAKDIYTLKDAGIIGGKSATEFDPEGDVTRAEFAKMVVGLFGYKTTSDAVNFEDCKAEDWFTPYVAAGVEAGVIKGVSDTEFAPNATITREDACTILGRALNKVAQSNELKFTDADKVAEYAAPYVALLSELGYVNGYEDGSFAPTNNITRAEAAKIIAGIYNANKSAETVTDDKTETDANADAAVDEKVEEKVEEKTDEKAVDTIETEPEK